MAAAGRPYQVVVWGATGYTGRLVSEHLTRNYQGRVRFALAGRSAAKLEEVRRELAAIDAAAAGVPLLVADAGDQASVDAVVAQAQVVLSTAGPYAQFGTPLVDAAVRLRTHYCDITGESWWIKAVAERYHHAAAADGVKIVHCCGYDSVPFDAGVFYVTDYVRRELGRACASVACVLGPTQGGVSGGTIASAAGLAGAPRDVQREVQGAYYLNAPPDERDGPDGPDAAGPQYDADLRTWTVPSIMGIINARIVRRSWALLGRQYGEHFSYTERMAVGGAVAAVLGSAAMMVGRVVMSSPTLLALARRVLPKQGEGPAREALQRGYYSNTFVAKTQEAAGTPPTVVVAECSGQGDPGYLVTSRWLLECGLCLALQAEELQAAGLPRGGVLTPASAMGSTLLGRLEDMGTHFSIKEVRKPEQQL